MKGSVKASLIMALLASASISVVSAGESPPAFASKIVAMDIVVIDNYPATETTAIKLIEVSELKLEAIESVLLNADRSVTLYENSPKEAILTASFAPEFSEFGDPARNYNAHIANPKEGYKTEKEYPALGYSMAYS